MSPASSAGLPENRRRSPSPALAGALSPNWVTRKVTPTASALRPASCGHLAQARDLRLEARQAVERIGRVGADRIPGIAQLGGAAQRRPALAADPDRRMRLLHRLGVDQDVVEADVLARELRVRLGPELDEGLDVFVGDLAALREIGRLDRLELLLHPAGADAQHQAAARQHVDGRQHLGGQYRGAMRHHHHRRDQAQLLRLGRDERHLDQLLVPFDARARGEFTGVAVGVFGLDVGRDHHMVAEGGVVEAHGLALDHQLHQLVGRRHRPGGRRIEAELHG